MSASAALSGAMRRGACPSLSAPMRTGDGLLVRLQPESGELTPVRLGQLAALAARHGNGLLEITARGNLQIRGLTEQSAADLEADVDALRIEPRRGVPVEAGPLAGLDPSELADAAPLSLAIRDAIRADGLESRLGPKVTVVVDGGGRIGLDDLLADIRVGAVRQPQGRAWLVSVAGTAATARPVALHEEADVPAAVVALLSAVAAMGRRARGRDLAVAPSPMRLDAQHRPAAGDLLIGPTKLRDGTHALVVGLAFGQVGASTLERFALGAERAGARAIRFAPQRRIIAVGLSAASAARLQAEAAEAGMIVGPDDPRLRVVACAGAPACASAFLDTKALAAVLAPLVGAQGLHLSGCAKLCAEPTGTLPALVGVSPGEAAFNTPRETRRIALSEVAEAVASLARTGGKAAAHPLPLAAHFAHGHRP